MGSGQVVSTIIEWAIEALRDHPLLVLPTLVILLSVVGLAVIEAATITVQVVTAMIRNYKHRLLEFSEACNDLWATISSRQNKQPILRKCRRLTVRAPRSFRKSA